MIEQASTCIPLIEIKNATVFRGDTKVFDRFSLTISQHEPVAILGPNGSGKTTLLKLINREVYPVHSPSPSVRILGQERWNVWELRSHIGVVSHDLQTRYHSATTAMDVVLSGFLSSVGLPEMLARQITGEQRERAIVALQELGIAHLADRRFDSMSTGQQRRCLLGRTMVHDPDTLILDEPTEGLDMAATFDYLNRIRKLSAAGKNVVLVSHSLSEIPPEIGRIVLLREGQIVADGPKSEVLTVENLQRSYGVDMRIVVADGYYLVYPEDPVD